MVIWWMDTCNWDGTERHSRTMLLSMKLHVHYLFHISHEQFFFHRIFSFSIHILSKILHFIEAPEIVPDMDGLDFSALICFPLGFQYEAVEQLVRDMWHICATLRSANDFFVCAPLESITVGLCQKYLPALTVMRTFVRIRGVKGMQQSNPLPLARHLHLWNNHH